MSWIGDTVEWVVQWFKVNFGWLFDAIDDFLDMIIEGLQDLLLSLAPIIMIALITLVALLITRRVILSIGIFAGLMVIDYMGYWESSMESLALVLIATLIALIIGIPMGILSSRYDSFESFVKVILDFMQTMPSFVYLIPVIFFFSIGPVPGVIATVVFAMPPAVKLTNLGIRQVPNEMNEVADAFGSNANQKLLKVQLPIAMPTIMAGINQTIMLSLSMVVIAAMIGAGGLGADIILALNRTDVGLGFEAGLAVVILAIMLDRMTQSIRGDN